MVPRWVVILGPRRKLKSPPVEATIGRCMLREYAISRIGTFQIIGVWILVELFGKHIKWVISRCTHFGNNLNLAAQTIVYQMQLWLE